MIFQLKLSGQMTYILNEKNIWTINENTMIGNKLMRSIVVLALM